MIQRPLSRNPIRPLAVDSVAGELRHALAALLPFQRRDAAHPDYGAYVRPEWQLADPSQLGTCQLVAAAMAVRALDDDASLDASITAGLAYLARAQRPSGLIDLRDCNADSAPDTAFGVLLLSAAYGLALPTHPEVARRVLPFIERALPGMAAGGFHTPNHRWAIASALARAGAILQRDVSAAVAAYTAEGPDIDADGAFLERSVGVYDAVTDRALLTLADLAGFPTGRAAAVANLAMDLALLNPDGSAETGLSHRYDHGTRTVPAGLASCYLAAAAYAGGQRGDFLAAAELLWSAAPAPSATDALYTLEALRRHPGLLGSTGAGVASLPDMTKFFPVNRLYRHRRGGLALSIFGGTTRILALDAGSARLVAMKISLGYFGTGRFVGDTIVPTGEGVALRSLGNCWPRRPGYELPLGRPVAPQDWDATLPHRQHRAMPPAVTELTLTPAADGVTIRFSAIDIPAGVPGQITFDFPPGGTWETTDTSLTPAPNQVLLLRAGRGRMRFGADYIELGPGSSSHGTFALRDAEPPAPGLVRVTIPLLCPTETTISLSAGRGL